ncbi:hypothetical protein AQUCO_00300061v1 [Aquilegia coerulea]|uniref:Protein POLAR LOCALIZATION DURING ASYMMETRIC DIVISION AND REDISTRIBUTION n=1 Tax=Aquilegia coerulea TaxID=218851 RepID=A0A2G5EX44_AQUCA|nr:hypothetical protein AQUCO_00300061v1 [Aquilegia coerulea]
MSLFGFCGGSKSHGEKKKKRSRKKKSKNRGHVKDGGGSSAVFPLFGCSTSDDDVVVTKHLKSTTLISHGQTNIPTSTSPSITTQSPTRDTDTKDVPFNMGVGFGLVFIIAAYRNELSKMAELKKEMELLISNFKIVVLRKDDVASESSQSNNNDSTFSVVENTSEISLIQNNAIIPSGSLRLERKTVLEHDPHSVTDTPNGQEYSAVQLHQLEAELEKELERLQLTLDEEEEWLGHRLFRQKEINIENTDSIKTVKTSEEMKGSQLLDCENSYIICPRELERRLFELLEEKQQKRINELESALKHSEKKLLEKEMEVNWWRDSARLASPQVSNTK